jgi:predicted nucleic acid-binding protein
MIKPRVYLDSSILITFAFGAKKEPDKFNEVESLFHSGAELVTSIYSLIELYNFPIYNFEHDKRIMAKYGILMVLSTDIEITPMLERGLKIMYSREFNMEDKSDIPHAISAFIERCEYIVTFDSHFKALTRMKSLTPSELLEFMKS